MNIAGGADGSVIPFTPTMKGISSPKPVTEDNSSIANSGLPEFEDEIYTIDYAPPIRGRFPRMLHVSTVSCGDQFYTAGPWPLAPDGTDWTKPSPNAELSSLTPQQITYLQWVGHCQKHSDFLPSASQGFKTKVSVHDTKMADKTKVSIKVAIKKHSVRSAKKIKASSGEITKAAKTANQIVDFNERLISTNISKKTRRTKGKSRMNDDSMDSEGTNILKHFFLPLLMVLDIAEDRNNDLKSQTTYSVLGFITHRKNTHTNVNQYDIDPGELYNEYCHGNLTTHETTPSITPVSPVSGTSMATAETGNPEPDDNDTVASGAESMSTVVPASQIQFFKDLTIHSIEKAINVFRAGTEANNTSNIHHKTRSELY
ncbi:hypothetical protein BDP27DRAFT_1430275 [Rhodocollybia butyracea]|uniref:Uncharacterized protein n=1 Tax=Rhodocollybia butyracea TaxID=206335 RepID=A0A9P5P8J6_9AGAR|nr:hypothetical protein BDP27DRAFT_1430275 [Rhodocollybia butyracea]